MASLLYFYPFITLFCPLMTFLNFSFLAHATFRTTLNNFIDGGNKMVISLRLSETDGELVKQYANRRGVTVSCFIRELLLDQIERDYKETLQKVEVMKEKQ